ncbi:shikimate dehydrogenase [Vreelandella piezotolerans]|jgi:shikimate dehydrogenase|uniref:Shikimate dehydrogenase (NADP(+)) n=1 Tax=Vreelandella piezotolerans TaxID=2609667 RepID=A0ABQ6X6M0_9GAMM|nr:shikimate dehydrogenase [Halomonas piezotolerans]KAE8437080.1 shikimate dehydrogenase [Halomonas piezotolerans]QJA23172.1 shikimate dehydrogenase [Halomonas piezotolerans]
MTDRYCVFGNPIKHSKSPLIHGEFARQTQQPMTYTAVLAPEDGFTDAWRAFVAGGGRGANVTVPFKGDAFALCDTLSYRAKRAQAVNTLIVGGNGRTYGDTTDGIGLVRDLAYHRVPLAGKRVLVLGAGGAVRGILEPLLAEKPSEVVVANRTVAKAEQLAEAFVDLGRIYGGGFASVKGPFDVVINGTSASLSGELPPLPETLFGEGAWAYDMMYGAEPTVFLQWAGPRGAKLLDGLGMLVEQAAESFFAWRNVRPETASVRTLLRQSLNY